MITKFKLFEYTDSLILDDGEKVIYNIKNTYPFLYLEDEFIVGEESASHMESIIPYYDSNDKYLDDSISIWDDTYLRGRIWLDYNVISFWGLNKNSNIAEVKQIVQNLEKELNITINVNNWLIEFSDVDNNKGYTLSISDYYNGNYDNAQVIKITKAELEKQKELHMMSPIEKEEYYKTHDKNISSVKPKPLAWKQALLRSESNIMLFDAFNVNENNNI